MPPKKRKKKKKVQKALRKALGISTKASKQKEGFIVDTKGIRYVKRF